MAGSAMTFAYDSGAGDGAGGLRKVRKVTISWTSDSATGAVTGTTAKLVGRLLKAVTVPSGGGTAPSLNYGIAITDEQSFNVLTNCKTGLTNRHNTNTEEVNFFLLSQDTSPLCLARPPVVCSKLTIAVSSAGNSKQGTIILYLE